MLSGEDFIVSLFWGRGVWRAMLMRIVPNRTVQFDWFNREPVSGLVPIYALARLIVEPL